MSPKISDLHIQYVTLQLQILWKLFMYLYGYFFFFAIWSLFVTQILLLAKYYTLTHLHTAAFSYRSIHNYSQIMLFFF